MGNAHGRPLPTARNKKQVHWKAAERPSPPGKPSLLTNDPVEPDVVKITWTKPVHDGGSPVTGYLVEHKRFGSPHWIKATPLMVPTTHLTVSGLEPGWRYQFRVKADNAVGLSDPSEASELLTVTLQRSAIAAPKFTQELQDTVVLEDDKVEFTVHFIGQPAPTICWFKDGFEIFSSRRTRIITDSDRSVLTIHQSAISDEGEIKCTATNRVGHASTKAKLTLEASPSIRLPRQYEEGIIFELGEAMRLKVTVAGRPTPLIFWSHNGESIESNERYEFEYNDRSAILKIAAAKRSDRGEYQIRAINKLGQDVNSFLVTVTDKPTPPGRAKVVMTLGRSVTLSWEVPQDDGGCKIGNYIIEYYRIGWDVWLKAATSRQLTTILGDLIEGSQYKFRIKAESPYGVSEPSEESDTVFIPDPKRGILQPNKAQTENTIISDIISSHNVQVTKGEINAPIRPERKLKTKTPEASPRPKKKFGTNLHMEEKDLATIRNLDMSRTSIDRELAYGIPEIKIKRITTGPEKERILANGETKPIESTALQVDETSKGQHSNLLDVNENNVMTFENSSVEDEKRLSPRKERSKSPAEHTQTFAGSSEFMLVLYPNESNFGNFEEINFENSGVPPPISLSAPELGIEPPDMGNLRRWASSTELLHYRLLERLNEAALAEEIAFEKQKNEVLGRKLSLDIPIIQINSKNDEDIVGLERRSSIGRRLSGGSLPSQKVLNQKRPSLQLAAEFTNVLANKLHKFPDTLESRRELMMYRQRSESEEREEEEFERVRKRMALEKQSSTEKRSIEVVEEEKWLEEDSGSSEKSYESSIASRKMDIEPPMEREESEEDTTYHPNMPSLGSNTPERKYSDEPFEILTIRKEPPDPSLVPKPILKKNIENSTVKSKTLPVAKETKSNVENTHLISRARTSSLSDQISTSKVEKVTGNLAGSNSRKNVVNSGLNSNKTVTTRSGSNNNGPQIEEEVKVVADHYGDIVKTFSSKSKFTNKPHSKYEESFPTSNQKAVNNEEEKNNVYEKRTNQINYMREGRTPSKSPVVSRDQNISITKNNKETENVKYSSEAGSSSVKDVPKQNKNIGKLIEKENKLPMTNSYTSPMRRRKVSRSNSRSKSRSPTPASKVIPKRSFQTREQKEPRSPTPLGNRVGRIQTMERNMPKQRRTSSSRRSNSSLRSSVSPRRRPILRESTTQTSFRLESYSLESLASIASLDLQRQEDLKLEAEVKVKNMFDYVTDLSILVVASWLYLFKNEYFAIPFLLIIVYRQIKEGIKKRIPNWLLKRLKRR